MKISPANHSPTDFSAFIRIQEVNVDTQKAIVDTQKNRQLPFRRNLTYSNYDIELLWTATI
jgi:hypothetical protein